MLRLREAPGVGASSPDRSAWEGLRETRGRSWFACVMRSFTDIEATS